MLKVTTIDNDTGSTIREQLLRSRSIVRVIDCTAIITAVDSHRSRGRGGYRIAIDCKSCCQTINGTKHFGICNCNLAAAFIFDGRCAGKLGIICNVIDCSTVL